MSLDLQLKSSEELTQVEKSEIENIINETIMAHKSNRSEINKLTMESITFLTAGQARAHELASQGLLGKLWNGIITGKNQQIRAEIDRNYAKSQYSSQMMIQKLAEQNLLTFDLVTAVNNKLNTLVVDVDNEINRVYQTLISFFKQTRSDIIQIQARIEKLERNVELLHWNTTIEYQMYDGVEYTELPEIGKIVCLSNDFLHRTNGEWSTGDLMLLKSTLAELGLPVKSKFSIKDFYRNMIEKPSLIERLFEGISLEGLDVIDTYEAPLVKGIEKLTTINGKERYVYETVAAQLQSANVSYIKQDLQLSIVHQFLLHNASMNADIEINLFDFIVGLLVDLQMINFSVSAIENNEILDGKIETENKEEYDVFLFSYGLDKKMGLIKAISEVNKSNLEESNQMVNNVPIKVFSRGTLVQAKDVAKRLESLGAQCRVKSCSEKYHTVRSNESGLICLRIPRKKNYVCEGDKVTSNTKIAFTNYESHAILAGVQGKVITLLVSHGKKLKRIPQ